MVPAPARGYHEALRTEAGGRRVIVSGDPPNRGDAVGRPSLGADQLKHLEFIQAVITRLGTNSFFIKGWALTLATGFFAVSASQLSWQVAGSGLVPLLCFWFLDGFFLRQERLFRYLYDDVRRPESTTETMSMDVRPYLTRTAWLHITMSRTLLLFYGALVGVDLLLICITL